jgi:hypothetical protein
LNASVRITASRGIVNTTRSPWVSVHGDRRA